MSFLGDGGIVRTRFICVARACVAIISPHACLRRVACVRTSNAVCGEADASRPHLLPQRNARSPRPPHSWLLLTLSSGCEPTNRLYYLDLASLPRDDQGTLDLGAYDRRKGDAAKELPIVKLVDNFEASWDYVANEGAVFTFHTNYKAPRNR